MTNMRETPWMANIRNDAGLFVCSGAIIGERYVLTAAHCVTCTVGRFTSCENADTTVPTDPGYFRVYYGSNVIHGGNLESVDYREVEAIYVHGEYDGYATKDIAIMKLSMPVEFNENVHPINYEHACSPINDGLATGSNVKFYGWGYDYNGDGRLPDTLRVSSFRVIALSTSEVRIGIHENNSIPCPGDSGGPLIMNKDGGSFLIGIMSTNNNSYCPDATRAKSERVQYYSSFIDHHLNHECAPSLSQINHLCYPSATAVSLINVGSAATTWTSSSNVRIVSRNNVSATVRAGNTNSSGNGWVRATLSNGVALTEGFRVGKPIINDGRISGISSIASCDGIYSYEFNGGISGASSTRWVLSGQFDNVGSLNRHGVWVSPTNWGRGYVTFVASNRCGEEILCRPVTVSGWNCGPGVLNFPGPYSCGSGGFFRAYPNPASSGLTIESSVSSGSHWNGIDPGQYPPETTYKLYNFRSEIVSRGQITTLTTIDVLTFEPGRYMLKIYANGSAETHHIVIQ